MARPLSGGGEQAPGESPGPPERVPLGRVELLLILAFWTCMAVLTALSQSMDPRMRDAVPRVFPAAPIAISFAQAYLWAVLTPAVFWLTNRFSIERTNWGWRLLLFVLVGVVVAVAMNAMVTELRARVIGDLFGGGAVAGPGAPSALPAGRPRGLPGVGPGRPGGHGPPGAWFAFTHLWFMPDFVVYLAIVAAGFARDYFMRYRRRQEEAARLEAEAAGLKAQLAEARLAALRSQLDPHFLFNTLNAVSSLVERDPRGVRRMISRLSELLRRSLDAGPAQEVPLEQELVFVERYLEIMQIRFQGSLAVRFDVQPEVKDALVPNLVLQPLVENAIKHGTSKVPGGGLIEIGARRVDGRVVLRVSDNGPGEDAAPRGEGLGLRNTRERLAAMYGPAQSLSFGPAADGGSVAEVVLPYHTAADLRTSAVTPDE